MQVRILSFNIHGGYDRHGLRDLRRVHNLMQDLNVDIGIFQEMETRPSRGGAIDDMHILAGPERPYHLPGLTMKEGESGWYGNLIVSRFPIIRGTVHKLKSVLSYEPRGAVDALIETPLGNMRVVGTHLSLSPVGRWREINSLIELMDALDKPGTGPLLLAGDINEWNPGARLLRHLNKIMKPAPCAPSFPSHRPVLRLDRAWYDRCDFPVWAQTLRIKGISHLSDHLPVLITAGNVDIQKSSLAAQ